MCRWSLPRQEPVSPPERAPSGCARRGRDRVSPAHRPRTLHLLGLSAVSLPNRRACGSLHLASHPSRARPGRRGRPRETQGPWRERPRTRRHRCADAGLGTLRCRPLVARSSPTTSCRLRPPGRLPTVSLAHAGPSPAKLGAGRARSAVHRAFASSLRHAATDVPLGTHPVAVPPALARPSAVIAAVAPSGPLVLGGHSMGGMTVLAYAGRHRSAFADRVRGTVLVSTTASVEGRKAIRGEAAMMRLASRVPLLAPRALLPTSMHRRHAFGENADPEAVRATARQIGRTRSRPPVAIHLDQRAREFDSLSASPRLAQLLSQQGSIPPRCPGLHAGYRVRAHVLPARGTSHLRGHRHGRDALEMIDRR